MKDLKKIYNWLKIQKNKQKIIVKEKNLSDLPLWIYKSEKIFHSSKKFFSIIGLRVISNFYKYKSWDQPIIYQNGSGILGIIRRNIGSQPEYLMKANVEPGNINKLQISPTVQATKSNYTRVHGGKKIKYLQYFLKIKKFLTNSKQTEQGFNYLLKKNKNILINSNITITPSDRYKWIKRTHLIHLIKKKNILNMDTLSVFSCSLQKNKYDQPDSSIAEINKWLTKMNKKFYIKIKKINLINMKNWTLSNKNILHNKKSYFSIIGINVLAKSREVSYWSQPIIQHRSMHFAGFVTKKINSTVHYLVKFIVEPGYKSGSITCSVKTSNISNYEKNKNLSTKSKFLLKNFFFNSKKLSIKYDAIQSHEGGRFYKSQIRYMVVEIKEKQEMHLDKNYKWISQNQMISLIKKGVLDIEARLCFACLNFDKII
jgi:dTDP-4-dehydro-6-deoxy-alpha-D-glucopyranose 2,3-dehydratase